MHYSKKFPGICATLLYTFPKPILPEFTKITDVLPDAIVIAIVIYAITFSLEKMMAKNHNYKVNPKQELRALAICQLLSCFFLCHPSSENLSRVKIGEDAGAKSQ
uniref:SLC26A/SulP transporter domain-containing protein n=1 Tax=Acrobeloides nanus TaxID=290746 RepID=A0A914ENQ0_9BILA